MEEKSVFESFELDVNQEIKEFLTETSKWSYFLSIMGFIGIGLMILGGISVAFAGSPLAWSEPNTFYGLGYSTGIALVYVILALVYFFPIWYLFKFSKNIKSALKLNNNEDFTTAFKNLKSHYKYMGIFTIVIVSMYILMIIGIAGGAASTLF